MLLLHWDWKKFVIWILSIYLFILSYRSKKQVHHVESNIKYFYV